MGFLDFLGNVLGGAGGISATLSAVFNFLLNAMLNLFTTLWNTLVDVFNFFQGILGKAANLFRYIWDNFFKRVFNGLFSAVMKAHDWLESKLGPILRFLQKMRAFIDNVMNKYVKPIMNIIQRMRQFLTVLKLFHVKFAEKLDARLLQIEVKMAAVFIEARQILNGIIDAVNLVIDPTKLLKHPILIISIRRSLPALVRSVTGLPLSFFVGSSNQLAAGSSVTLPASGLCGGNDVDIPPSKLMNDFEGIPIFGFVSDNTEPSPDDVDSLEPVGMFAVASNEIGDCASADEYLAKARQRVIEWFDEAPSRSVENISAFSTIFQV